MNKKLKIAEQANYLIRHLKEYKNESGVPFLELTLYNCRIFLLEMNAQGGIKMLTENLIRAVNNGDKVPVPEVQKLINAFDEMAQIMVAMNAHQKKETANEN